jgi:hypothetical protein
MNKLIVKQLFLSAKELSVRWGMSIHTLKKWRLMGKGPQCFKISGHASYKIEDIEEFEREAEWIARLKKENNSENE